MEDGKDTKARGKKQDARKKATGHSKQMKKGTGYDRAKILTAYSPGTRFYAFYFSYFFSSFSPRLSGKTPAISPITFTSSVSAGITIFAFICKAASTA